jgi:hypothetical protein
MLLQWYWMRSGYVNLLQNLLRVYIIILVYAGIALLQFVSGAKLRRQYLASHSILIDMCKSLRIGKADCRSVNHKSKQISSERRQQLINAD